MRSKFYLTVLCIYFFNIGFSSNGEKKYYYAYNEKMPIVEIENKLVISFVAHSSSELKNTLSLDENIKSIQWVNDNIYILTVESFYTKILRNNLKAVKEIKSIQPVYQTADGLDIYITDEIVVKFNEKVSKETIENLHKKYNVSVKKTTSLYQLLSVPIDADALEIANMYQLSGLVEYSHPNFFTKIELHLSPPPIPDDPYFSNQFHLFNTGQSLANGKTGTAGADINVLKAWNITKGNNDIIVAVIDQGVISDHPDLPNSSQIRLNGSNFSRSGDPNDPSPVFIPMLPYALPPVPEPEADPILSRGNHGNACAGIIAASHNNEGIAGIAPDCKIMPIRIFDSLNSIISYNSVADAITFAKDSGADIISNSWGFRTIDINFSPVIKDAIIDAVNNGRNGKGCIVIFSAGNTADLSDNREGFIGFPANINIEVDGVIVVGASDRNDNQANYSPISILYGDEWLLPRSRIDVVAPSHSAYSCQISSENFEVWSLDIPGNMLGDNPVSRTDCGRELLQFFYDPASGTNFDAYTGRFGGTSASCPQVAGVAALMLSVNPNLTQLEVAQIIKSTARKAGNYSYQNYPDFPDGNWSIELGYGVINAHAAVVAANCFDENVAIVTGTITDNDIWVEDMYAAGTLIIDSSVTLTIQSTVQCSPYTKIIVKPGGKLIVDGGTLTSSCTGELWQGIEVWGDPTDIDQHYFYQGMLEMNNALIENAECAIYVGCRSLADQQAGIGGGGIVFADNSIFRNNKKSVEIRPYTRQYNSGNELFNRCYFKDCEFIMDDKVLFSNNIIYHVPNFNDAVVSLFGVRDVQFKGCVFRDDRTETILSRYVTAIYGNNASISMDGTGYQIPHNPFVPTNLNSFSGFGDAIVLKNTGTKASKIKYANFNNNNVAIYASATDKLSVLSCNIYVDAGTRFFGKYGIFLEDCDGYIIENNIFAGDGTGLRIENSGEGNNIIQHNDFRDMCLVSLTSGINGQSSNDWNACIGLQFKCNKFSQCGEGIRVDKEPESRIRYMQGTPNFGAGNIFDNPNMIYLNNTSQCCGFMYSYNQTQLNHEPLVNIWNTNSPPILTYPVNTHYCSGIGYMGPYYYMREMPKMEQQEAKYTSLKQTIEIKKANYIERYGDEEINWTELIDSGDDLMRIPQVRLYVEIVELAEEIQWVCNEVFQVILSDTVFDKVLYNTWLLRENKLRSDYLLASSYVESGDWANANQVLQDLKTRFPDYTRSEYNDYITCLNYETQFYNMHPLEVSEDDLTNIEGYLSAFEGIAAAKIKALWEYITGTISCRELENACMAHCDGEDGKEEEADGHKSMNNQPKNLESIENSQYILSAYPNPFGDILQIRLDNVTDLNIEQVSVYDISGRMLRAVNSIENTRTNIQLSDLSTGVYFIYVTLTNGETKVKRVIKE